MNRREFLSFRTAERKRVVELSCERLFMQCFDAQITWESSEDLSGADHSWGGEPASVFERRTADQLFIEIEGDLAGADVLRVTEPQWLSSEPFGRRVETLIASFRARGGRVEFIDGRSTP